jgi:hypothetical protein
MSRPNLNTVRCEALFASSLRRSDTIAPDQVRAAIAQTIRALGGRGCAAWVAQEYGDYPEAAVTRMQWARTLVAQAYAGSDPLADDAGPVRPGVIAAA